MNHLKISLDSNQYSKNHSPQVLMNHFQRNQWKRSTYIRLRFWVLDFALQCLVVLTELWNIRELGWWCTNFHAAWTITKEKFILEHLFTGLWSQGLKTNGRSMYIKYKTGSAQDKVHEKFQWQLKFQINRIKIAQHLWIPSSLPTFGSRVYNKVLVIIKWILVFYIFIYIYIHI